MKQSLHHRVYLEPIRAIPYSSPCYQDPEANEPSRASGMQAPPAAAPRIPPAAALKMLGEVKLMKSQEAVDDFIVPFILELPPR